jgi:EEF1A lysine methyltransferase 4
MVGCGNSKLSEEMAVDGYPMITNVDISTSVINKMHTHYSEKYPL